MHWDRDGTVWNFRQGSIVTPQLNKIHWKSLQRNWNCKTFIIIISILEPCFPEVRCTHHVWGVWCCMQQRLGPWKWIHWTVSGVMTVPWSVSSDSLLKKLGIQDLDVADGSWWEGETIGGTSPMHICSMWSQPARSHLLQRACPQGSRTLGQLQAFCF